VDRQGKMGCPNNRPDEDKNISTKKSWEPPAATYMADVYVWANNYIKEYGYYHLIGNNCQDFCLNFWKCF